MLTIRDEQLDAFRDGARAQLRLRLIKRLKTEFGERSLDSPDHELVHEINQIIEVAPMLEVHREDDLYRLVRLYHLMPAIADTSAFVELLFRFLTAIDSDPRARLSLVERNLFEQTALPSSSGSPHRS